MPKPQFPMHDYHLHKSLRTCVTAVGLSMASGLAYYFLHHLPLKAKYKNFYSNYDPMASFNRMMAGGYLSSCPAPSKGSNEKDKKK
ncbi:hypothetical protein FF38_06506 [Lucilia cuprina]|uniref:Uncharacterized protein n=1 Tax=Lucilia cuprina TaxID=7375 RepID=A0A0L0C581_LUCCU|nr:hypothetical protein CVS40_7330 [Lucilia cuprina]KNC27392.1 hypothetical protein FF38_06506 [Lucilia cuprina]